LHIFEDLLKGKLVRVHSIMRDGGEEVQLHPLVTWMLNGGEWGSFTSRPIHPRSYWLYVLHCSPSQVRTNIRLLLQAACYLQQ
jgi:hypothetical protein